MYVGCGVVKFNNVTTTNQWDPPHPGAIFDCHSYSYVMRYRMYEMMEYVRMGSPPLYGRRRRRQAKRTEDNTSHDVLVITILCTHEPVSFTPKASFFQLLSIPLFLCRSRLATAVPKGRSLSPALIGRVHEPRVCWP